MEYAHGLAGSLAKAEYPDLSLRLYLQGTLTAVHIRFPSYEEIAYEFLSQVRTTQCLIVNHSICMNLRNNQAWIMHLKSLFDF